MHGCQGIDARSREFDSYATVANPNLRTDHRTIRLTVDRRNEVHPTERPHRLDGVEDETAKHDVVTVTVEGADDFERRPSVPQRSCYVRLAATPMRPAIMPAVDLVAGKPQIFEFVEGGVEHVYNGPPLIPGGILKGRRNSRARRR